MFLANSWVTFMMSPAGVDPAGVFAGDAWAAMHNFLWNPINLHRFVASDPGRGLHNHPWKHALSLLLCGSYRETRMLRADSNHALQHRELRPGRLNFISGDVFHRINLPQGSERWSLFVHAPKASDWGFIQRRGYQDHNEVVTQASNPLWWKQALRPIQCPQMRLPVI